MTNITHKSTEICQSLPTWLFIKTMWFGFGPYRQELTILNKILFDIFTNLGLIKDFISYFKNFITKSILFN